MSRGWPTSGITEPIVPGAKGLRGKTGSIALETPPSDAGFVQSTSSLGRFAGVRPEMLFGDGTSPNVEREGGETPAVAAAASALTPRTARGDAS